MPVNLEGKRLWIDFVGRGTYDKSLFVSESLVLGFNRRTGNHVPGIGDFVIFSVWDRKKESAMAFAVGVIDGYSFILDHAKLASFLNELETALAKCQNEACSELTELKNNINELLKEVEKAKGSGGSKVTRGCGEYTTYSISYDPQKFYSIVKLSQRYFGKLPLGVFVDGHLIAYDTLSECPLPIRFARGVLALSSKEEKEVRKVLHRCTATWKVVDSKEFENFRKLSVLEDYRQVKHRTAAERSALRAALGKKESGNA